VTDAGYFSGLASLAALGLETAGHDRGIVRAGTVDAIVSSGELYKTHLELADKPQTSISVMSRVNPQQNPLLTYQSGDRVIILGVIVDTDAQTIAHLPDLLPRFERCLPNATLRIVTVDFLIATNGLAQGEVDVAVGPEQAAFPPSLFEPMYAEGIVLAARRDHEKLVRCLLREQFDEIEFVDVQLALGKGGVGNMLMTELLARHGLSWRVGMVAPDFTTAAHAAAVSDYVVGLPTRAARAFCEFLPLKVIELPEFLSEPTISMALIWHPRTEEDAGARYFRNLVLEACRQSAPPSRATSSDDRSRPRATGRRSARKSSAR
jgi:DNA-binding transcriptional LysR family regulator